MPIITPANPLFYHTLNDLPFFWKQYCAEKADPVIWVADEWGMKRPYTQAEAMEFLCGGKADEIKEQEHGLRYEEQGEDEIWIGYL